ncbi:hypothetical protein OESDEN_01009, partial [Oesophagostomum dentatum]
LAEGIKANRRPGKTRSIPLHVKTPWFPGAFDLLTANFFDCSRNTLSNAVIRMIAISPSSSCTDMEASTSRTKEMAKADMTQVVALAVISRLHDWCVQLFWITVFCVMGCCGDEKSRTSIRQLHDRQQHQQQTSRKRASMAEIEMKLLRHITSPLLSNLRPVTRSTKKRPASRPPSPQLFDIEEETED